MDKPKYKEIFSHSTALPGMKRCTKTGWFEKTSPSGPALRQEIAQLKSELEAASSQFGALLSVLSEDQQTKVQSLLGIKSEESENE